MPELTLQSMVGRGSEHVETRVGSQTMMMSVEQGKYFSVDASANRIWELLEQPMTIQGIIDRLLLEYEVDPAACQTQVLSFVRELHDNGLVVEH
ncbi:MAG: PqqD family peptide modification chaperone [Pseudomonadota bacterium]